MATAQNIRQNLNAEGKPISVEFSGKAQVMADDALDVLEQYLKPNNQVSFQLVNQKVDNLGYLHQGFQQYYKGIKVENAIYLVHSYQNKIYLINGDFRNLEELNTKSNLSI